MEQERTARLEKVVAGDPGEDHDGTRWRRLIRDACVSARRGRHAQGVRMARAAAGALERRRDAPGAAEAQLMVARLALERGDTVVADLAAQTAARVLGSRVAASYEAEAELRTAAALWRGRAALDAGEYDRVSTVAGELSSAQHEGDPGWVAVVTWSLIAGCAHRRGVPAVAPPADDAWAAHPPRAADSLVTAAWADRIGWYLAAGDVFQAGRALAGLRLRAVDDAEASAEVAVAQLGLAGATGDHLLVGSRAAEALRLADGAHLPWARLRALAAWRDAARWLAGAEAVVLRMRVRRVAARAPRGWRDAVREPERGDVRAVESARPRRLRPSVCAEPTVPGLVGESALVRVLRSEVARAARTPFPVLIEGETGSGKELVARGLHALSPRAGHPFRDVNCAALAEELLDAELFGHARGAFTGAVGSRAGLIEEASGGTLFLDEVADLSPRAQARLLRSLQEQEVRRVGEAQGRAVNVRVVSACNRPLDGEVAAGRFRADLLYRLAAIRIRVPPLRERLGDIPLLVEACWPALAEQAGTSARIGPDVLAALARHTWPGNVRELQHALVRLAIRAPASGVVGAACLPEGLSVEEGAPQEPLMEARGRFELDYVQAALARHGASRTATARALGLSRQGLRKLLVRTGAVAAARSR